MLVNQKRFKTNLFKIGKIGENKKGGIDRTAFSDSYFLAVNKVKKLMIKAGMEVRIDKIGNLIGKKKGINNNSPSIIIGSHLDTVPNGGLFDGNLGVIAGLECINILNDNNIKTNHPIEVIAFNAEEGSEMGGTFGSRAMMGNVNLDDDLNIKKNIKKYGLTIKDLKEVRCRKDSMAAYLELHIEQGLDLVNNNISMGIVKDIAGITRYKITALGESDHAGTTSMSNRKDALIGAVKLIKYIEQYAKNVGDPFVATVGDIKVFPGVVNVIPGKVKFLLELRDPSKSKMDDFFNHIKKFTENIEKIKFSFIRTVNKLPVKLDKNIINIIKKTCDSNNIRYKVLTSGAGHDAKAMSQDIPTGLIFVPSVAGKSHCKEEWTDLKDCYQGTEILYNTLLSIDDSM